MTRIGKFAMWMARHRIIAWALAKTGALVLIAVALERMP
jgi:hypothetical protein